MSAALTAAALDPFSLAATYPWRVAAHSFLCALVLYAWVRRLRLGPGRTKRWLLAVALVLPLLTAAMPAGLDDRFRQHDAWLDTSRLLALPAFLGLRVGHLALALAALAALVTIGQELLPVLARATPSSRPLPAELLPMVRSLDGWERVELRLVAGDQLLAAAGGWPLRPRLLLSEGAIDALSPAALAAVVRHEHAHATPRRWWPMHLLFAVRLLQLWNPVAMWLFREYAVETEIACDRAAVGAGDPHPLARALLAVYERLHRRDLTAAAVLRRRVDLLLGRLPPPDDRLALSLVLAATALLGALLPWIA